MVDEWDAATEAAVTVEACDEADVPARSPVVEVEAAGSTDKSPRERAISIAPSTSCGMTRDEPTRTSSMVPATLPPANPRMRLCRCRTPRESCATRHTRSTSLAQVARLRTSDEAMCATWQLTLLHMCLCVAERFAHGSGILAVEPEPSEVFLPPVNDSIRLVSMHVVCVPSDPAVEHRSGRA